MFLRFSQTRYLSTGPDPGVLGVRSSVTPFIPSSVVGNILTVSHMLNSEDVIVVLMDPNGEQVKASRITPVGPHTVEIDISHIYRTSDQWRVLVGAKSKVFALGMTGFSMQFTQADLVDWVLSVPHSLGSVDYALAVYDANKRQVIPGPVITTDANNITVSFKYGPPLVGTWYLVVIASTVAKGAVSATAVSFVDSEIVGGNLTVGHGLNSTKLVVQVFDDMGNEMLPSGITIQGNNIFTISFQNGIPITGTWSASILATT
jgi:hypothetical protein